MDWTRVFRRPPATADVPVSRRQLMRLSGVGLATVAMAKTDWAAQSAVNQSAVPATADDSPFPAETQLALTTIVETSLAQTQTPGALVGVWYPGRGTWVHAAGISDLSTAAPVTVADHVRIASITKTFTATVVLQLVDEGKLSLDDHLEQFVPGIPNGDQITLRQVLGMTAGIYDFVADPTFAEAYERDPVLPFTPQQAVDIIRAHEPNFPPGAEVRYSNSNYILLGLIIEQITGQSPGAAITERIITPLGLANTSVPTTPDLPEPYTHGYLGTSLDQPLRDVTRSNPAVPWTSGDMISTLGDLRIWSEALASGTLLSAATQRERLTWSQIATPSFNLGYGLGVMEVNGLIGHNGGIFGYSSWMLHAPAEGMTLVVVTNRAATEGGTADPIFYGIVQLLLPDRFPPVAATPEVGTPAAAAAAP